MTRSGVNFRVVVRTSWPSCSRAVKSSSSTSSVGRQSRMRMASARGQASAGVAEHLAAEQGQSAQTQRVGQHDADALPPLRRPELLVWVVAAAEIQLGYGLAADQ